MNYVLSTCFRQPFAQAKSPVNTIARTILSRISVHLNHLDAENGWKRMSLERCRSQCHQALLTRQHVSRSGNNQVLTSGSRLPRACYGTGRDDVCHGAEQGAAEYVVFSCIVESSQGPARGIEGLRLTELPSQCLICVPSNGTAF